ncbi:scavenger receptor class F member 1-like [Ptychodera flava]|uniref:scavenger receptor class F member 1-like n=1 Tax=Ptychodera flava TaxID=63121 RepID=UPI00396A039E
MVITSTFISVFVIVQSLCFQTDVAAALRRTVGPVDIDTVERQHVCKWFVDKTGNTMVYRCCSGLFLNGSQCIECPEGSHSYGCGGLCQCEQYEQCDSVYGCQCVHNNWGNDCQVPCRQLSCEENKYCDRLTGECICPPGMYGTSCQYDCACYNKATCQKHTGECRCQRGWIGETCTDCDEGLVFPSGRKFCTDKCLHCFNGDLCDINLPGDCDCAPGWTGNKCNVSIPETCDSRFNAGMCIDHSDCDEYHICNIEICECDRCIKGYRGEQCNLPCETGKYGYSCKLSCSDVCGYEKCHHITGNCTACAVGYHGENCDVKCPAGHFGYNCRDKCQCSESMTCNHEFGCTCHKDCTTLMSYNTSMSQTSEITTQGRPLQRDQDDHLPWIIGVCAFPVLLIIINVIVCVVCWRKRTEKRTVSKRNVYYENVCEVAERTETSAMFGYEMADVGTPGPTILTIYRHPTNVQNGDDENNTDASNRNTSIPKYTHMATVHNQYSEVAGNDETSTAESQNAPGEYVHYYTLEEIDDKKTHFEGAKGFSGGSLIH